MNLIMTTQSPKRSISSAFPTFPDVIFQSYLCLWKKLVGKSKYSQYIRQHLFILKWLTPPYIYQAGVC